MDISNGAILNTLSGNITRARSPAPDSRHATTEKAPRPALNNTDTVTISKAARALNDENIKAVEPVKSVDENKEESTKKTAQDAKNGTAPTQLSEQDVKQVQELKKRDVEVRRHEAAHLAAAGKYASGSPSYEVKRGPDGKSYAVGGEVGIDTSPIAGDPQATLQKAQQIRAAAQAPANPSAQDRRVAASASQMETEARREIASLTINEQPPTNKPEPQQTKNDGVTNSTANTQTADAEKGLNDSGSDLNSSQDQTKIQAASIYQQVENESIAKTQNDKARLIDLVA